jgi:arylsulfatase A-like enzyme
VRHPGLAKRGVVCEALVSLADLTPTVLDFAKAEPGKGKFHSKRTSRSIYKRS